MAAEDSSLIGIDGVPTQNTNSYNANYKVHRKGISYEESCAGYNTWAPKYDEDLCPGVYNGPEIAAEFLAEYYPESKRADVNVLDVAAGTGRVGVEIHKRGFRTMDALEPSEGMLDLLKEKNIYKNTFLDCIGVHKTEIQDDVYDCIAIAGGMGEGHIPVTALDEMIRVVKPGGMICIVMREEYLQYVEEYVDKLEPYMKNLEKDGKWKQISRKIVPNYSFKKNGVVYQFLVL